ncbi:arginase family protein [Sphaerisporangium krabiense]|uniref:Arginase n=1 Tax=Sphaerisporangium krabiense TaxID=763782 RepID=A0A7W8Z9V8_9ACTN|nr:arginase family protein [Sphaerisporangium krabiense]MBB5629990.1 arginase [Sphaerisporangium krabiense]
MTTVLSVPQWQGSGAEGAPRLAEGARRAAELLPDGARVTVPVLEAAGEHRDGVRALDVLVENLRLTRKALDGIDDVVVTVGGDCGVDLAPIAAARARYGDELTVLWIDAHPDLYLPHTVPTGAFHGMILRTLLGEGPAELVPARPLAPEQVIIAGLRAGDPVEREYLGRAPVRTYGVAELDKAVDGLSGPVYVHIDLDVLDPQSFRSVCYPEPDGIVPEALAEAVARLDHVVGAAITEHAPPDGPADPGEAEVIRRIAAALPVWNGGR